MDLDDTPQQAAYRAEVRKWLQEHASEAPVTQGPDAISDEDEMLAARRAWQGKLAEGGLAGVTWPKEFGGQGLGPIEQVICNQEIGRAGVPGILDAIGVGMLGPTIIAHGSDEQKTRYLGPMLHGDEVWCQLFSEPAAGSDLAAVQSRARQQDDGSWRLSGQKVWTTNAQFASFGLLLARTDPDVPKHKGLTMFVVPMDGPGVTVRGLRQISGEAEFNEVFFDDAPLEVDAVVGGVGNGWTTALTTLMFERVTIGLGSEGLGYNSTRFARAIAAEPDARRDPEVRHELGEIASELLAVRFTGYRTLTALQKGQIPGPEAGLAKVTIVSSAIRAGDLIADVLGPDALAQDSEWAYMISFLPGLKSAGGTEEILRNTIGERVLGLPPAPRLDKGIPFSELREAARGALSRFKTLEAAREALDGKGALPDLWPMAKEAGWPGLLIDEDHGGAGLDAFDAMLVMGECGRVLAGVALLGHLPATAILNESSAAADQLESLASGDRRAAYLPAAPPDDIRDRWSTDPERGLERGPAPEAVDEGGTLIVTGELHFVPDAPAADLLVGVALVGETPIGFAVEGDGTGVSVEATARYDATRSLGHVSLKGAPALRLDAPEAALMSAWHLAQSLIAAESLGSVETALDVSVAYAKERHTFGRAIGSYQAVKHSLTEVLRQLDNGRSLLYYAGWSRNGAPREFPLAASAARSVAGRALDQAARTMISVHGGIGATWEHDAPLYFRRAQLSRRLLGGTAAATDRVAGEIIAQAAAA